jgi:hypothetical protein
MSKAKKKAGSDRHKSSFLVRLPTTYRELKELLRRKYRRPFTTEVQMALDEYAAKDGWKPPDSST